MASTSGMRDGSGVVVDFDRSSSSRFESMPDVDRQGRGAVGMDMDMGNMTDDSADVALNSGLVTRGIRQRRHWGRKHFMVLSGLGLLLLVGVAVVVWTTYFDRSDAAHGTQPDVPVKANLDMESFVLNHTLSPSSLNARWATAGDVAYSFEDGSVFRYTPTGGRELFVPASLMKFNGVALEVFDFSVSVGADWVILFTDKKPVYRHSFLATYYALEMSTSQVTPLTGVDEQLQYVSWTPSGGSAQAAYVKDYDVYVLDVATKTSTLVSKQQPNVWNGIPEWSYEEEVLETNNALYWSPDGALLAWMSFNVAPVEEYHIPVYTNSPYPQDNAYDYPAAGFANPTVQVWVYSTTLAGEPSRVSLDVDGLSEADRYVVDVQWADFTRLAVTTMNRPQNVSTLMVGEVFAPMPATIPAVKVLDVVDDKWLEMDASLTFAVLDANLNFFQLQVHDGYRHIAMYELTYPAAAPVWITSGAWEVTAINAVDPSSGVVYYTATYNSPLERNLYATAVASPTDSPVPLCVRGWNVVSFSATLRYYWLDVLGPRAPSSAMYETNNPGEVVVPGVSNTWLEEYLGQYDMPTVQYRQFLSADTSVTLNGYMITPPGVSLNTTTRKYPALIYVYGGPGSQTVTKQYALSGTRARWHFFLASQGYIVVSVDNRGTGGRGQTFLQANFHHLGEKEVLDQLSVADFLSQQHYVDANKIGIWGWSFGGYMTARVLCKASPLIAAGMSVAPVTDWRFYDSIYTERYMGQPTTNEDGYKTSSVLTFAAGIPNDALLLVHGTGDDNVHFLNSMELTNQLVQNQILFDMMAYPNQQHGLSTNGAQDHIWRLLTRQVFRKLAPSWIPQISTTTT